MNFILLMASDLGRRAFSIRAWQRSSSFRDVVIFYFALTWLSLSIIIISLLLHQRYLRMVEYIQEQPHYVAESLSAESLSAEIKAFFFS